MSSGRPIENILTIDVEDWYHLNYASMERFSGRTFESRLRRSTEMLLETLSEYGAEATFFFLGDVAKQYPDLVRTTQQMGHEIASHGYGHHLVYAQTRDEFRADVKQSLDVLEQICQQPVVGYRAPSWSISRETPWAHAVLAELGLDYDASLFPYRTYLYGDSEAPVRPFVLEIDGRCLYEIPASVLAFGRFRVPFGGGFYFRAAPCWMTRLATYLANRRGQPVVFYLHPREIDPGQPRLPLPWRDYLVTYVNLAGTLGKLRRLLSSTATISLKRYLATHGPAIAAAASVDREMASRR